MALFQSLQYKGKAPCPETCIQSDTACPWNTIYSLERSRSVCVGRFLRYIKGQSQDIVHYIHMMLFRITLSEITVVMDC